MVLRRLPAQKPSYWVLLDYLAKAVLTFQTLELFVEFSKLVLVCNVHELFEFLLLA